MEMNEISGGFKMTELGPLPEEWEVARMGDYCNVHSGYAFKSQDFCEDGILVVKIGNLQNDTVVIDNRTSFFPSEKVSEYLRKFILEKDNVLIALTGATTGKIAVVPEKFGGALLNQRVGKFAVFNEGLHSPFSRFYFTTKEFQEKIKENILQSAQGNVSPKQIENIRIPLPPLPEQRAIAKVLSTVQEAKERTDAVISATKALKKSLMKHLFCYGPVSLEEAENVPLNETEIGLVPEAWEVVRLNKVCETKTGGTPSRQNERYYNGDIPWVKSGELKDTIINFTEERITELGLKNSSAKLFPLGTLLIAMYGATVGKTAILSITASTNQAICAIFPNDTTTLSNEFLRYYFIFAREKLLEERYGGAQPNISQTIIRNTKIPLPPFLQQQKIASILSAVDEKIEKEDNKKKALDELFKTLLHNLMTGKLRVNHLEV